MKVLMMDTHYPEYLEYFYGKNPHVTDLSLKEHRDELFNDHCAWPADLARYMNSQGIETEFIVANDKILQEKWAEENFFKSYSSERWEKEIVMEQIRRFRPDVLWLQSVFDYFGVFLKEALPYCRKAITWISCKTPPDLDVSGFKTLITNYPETLKKKQHFFEKVIIANPGFDADILTKMGKTKKRNNLIFVGGMTRDHMKRVETLAYLIGNGIDVQVYGYVLDNRRFPKKTLKKSLGYMVKQRNLRKGIGVLRDEFVSDSYRRNVGIIKSAHRGPVFGMDMYRKLASSDIALNIHIDISENHAGNMRMFEATGAGTCLLTERTANIEKLFVSGKEILTYGSKEELVDVVRVMLERKEQLAEITSAGQQKTLKSHSIERMFNDIRPALDI